MKNANQLPFDFSELHHIENNVESQLHFEANKKRFSNQCQIVYDESHYLNQNEQGNYTSYLQKHKVVSNLPSSAKYKADFYFSELTL